MAVLQVQQVAAPDLSSTSSILANAGKSFDNGIQSAKDLLSSYQAGQQSKGDALLLGELAGLKTEEELASFLGSTDFSKLNLSEGMRANVLGARSTILGNDATRQGTLNARDDNARQWEANSRAWNADGRAQAAEGRVAAEYLDSVNARTELRGLTPYVVGAVEEGRQYGTGGAPKATGPVDTSFMSYSNQGATRNDPLSDDLIRGMSFLGEMGIRMDVVSGGQESNKAGEGTGSTRHNHGNAADVDFYMGDRRLNWNNAEDRKIFEEITRRAVDNGVTGIGAGDDYMGAGRMHVGFGTPGVWGAGGKGANAPEWLRAAYGGGGPQFKTSTTPVTQNPASFGAGAALAGALGGTKYMTPEQAVKLAGYGYDAQTVGQSMIDTAEAKRVKERTAEGQLSILNNPDVLTVGQGQKLAFGMEGLSPSQQVAAGIGFGNLAGSAQEVLAPTVAENPVYTDALARAAATNATADANDPKARAIALAQTFKDSGDVGGTLLSEFNVPEGSGLDSAYVSRRITQMAYSAGVTPAQMAATLSSTAQGNFGQFDAMLNAASDTDMYRSVMSLADKAYGPEAMSAYEKFQSDISSRDASIEATKLKLSTAKTSAAKFPAGSTERAEADRKVRLTEAAIIADQNPIEARKNTMEYLSGRIIGFDPSSVAGRRTKLERFIHDDNSLNDEEKLLLILGLRV